MTHATRLQDPINANPKSQVWKTGPRLQSLIWMEIMKSSWNWVHFEAGDSQLPHAIDQQIVCESVMWIFCYLPCWCQSINCGRMKGSVGFGCVESLGVESNVSRLPTWHSEHCSRAQSCQWKYLQMSCKFQLFVQRFSVIQINHEWWTTKI